MKHGIVAAAAFILLSVVVYAAQKDAAEDTRVHRPYREGPLTAGDFRARPPAPNSEDPNREHAAWIRTRLEYRFQTFRRVDRNGVTLSLAKFEAEAAIIRDQSWLREPNDRVLTHEQGHFDVMQIIALEWTSQQRAAIAKGDALQVRRDTLEEANDEMDRLLRKQFAERLEQSDTENEYYDVFTKHGREDDKQTEYHRVQARRLEELQKLLKRK